MQPTEYMLRTRETVAYDEGAHELSFHINTTRQDAERMFKLLYCATKLCGEAGEVAEQIGKMMRDDHGQVTDERLLAIDKELGDLAWYWHRICDELSIPPEAVLSGNIDKLRSRKERGVISGSGSDR